MFHKPKEFTDDQWEMVIKIRVYKLFSTFIYSFAPVFYVLYIMQHMTVSQRSIQTGLSTAVLAAAAWIFIVPCVKRNIERFVLPLTITGCIIGLICNALILQYPVVVIFIMATICRSVNFFQDKGFSKVINRCLQGDAKTEFGYMRERVDGLAVILASFVCWLCADLPLLYIVIADSVLSVIDVWLIWARFKLFTGYLEKHPYEEREER